ncbi:ABC transporter ATP-binding protein [Candidatus Parvarchaeota archaeon]|nr:ABC transporter ATP-binding protein [Candidatus Parvarchaeota archaeon]
MQKYSIEALNLNKRYGQFNALSDINLKIEGNKCVGFLGPNGAGKTTTLKIFTDMIKPSSGQAFINGIDVNHEKKKALKSVGALIETPEIYPSLTEREALSMIGQIKGIPKEKLSENITKVADRVKMKEWLDKKVGKMSKGMKQRINIAAALLGDPDVILLDEPTSGLDPRGMSEVRDIIKELKKENHLIFMSSHILSEVSEICDEVAMINHGKLLAYGSISDIVAKFQGKNQNVVSLSFASPLTKLQTDKIGKIKGVTGVEVIDNLNLNITIDGDSKKQSEILSSLVELKLGLTAFKPSSGLEDAYLSVFKEVA